MLKMDTKLRWKIIGILPDFKHAKMASRKRERYEIKSRI